MLLTELFMSDIKVGLVIDRHQCEEALVDTGIPQRSPVSLILFPIYLSGVFKNIGKPVEGCVVTSFADNGGWLLEVDLV